MHDLRVVLDSSVTAEQELTLATISSLPKASVILQCSYISSSAVRDLYYYIISHYDVNPVAEQ